MHANSIQYTYAINPTGIIMCPPFLHNQNTRFL